MTPAPAEQVLFAECAGEQLLGILSPAAEPTTLGVIIVVGGPQYRAGSHRQFTQLARALAGAGYPALRFDCRGMGDSTGPLRSFDRIHADIDAAMTSFQRALPGVRRFVLWGLCDGASAALLYLQPDAGPVDPRVAGLALLNPWVRSEASLARTHVKHYYLRRLMEGAFWLKLARGQVAFPALMGLGRNLRRALARQPGSGYKAKPFQERMAQAWETFAGPRLLMLSENDFTAKEFGEFTAASATWQRALRQRPPERVLVPDADHTCSEPAARRAVEAATVEWLDSTLCKT